MRRRPRNLPLLLLVGGIVLLAGVAVAVVLLPRGGRVAQPTTATTTAPPPPPTTTIAPPPPPPTTTAPPPPPPAQAPMSWEAAGGLVWHAGQIDPVVLADRMRGAGFGWVAIQIADGESETPIPARWIERFRAASGLPVGGWSVLRDDPDADAALAARLVGQLGLDFYVADAEREYERTNGPDESDERFARSGRFVAAFRAAEPNLPAGISSYCRADRHDLDWGAWAGAGFVFLPQAYVSQLGSDGAPAVCARGAAGFFPADAVHPTIDAFAGPFPTPTGDAYAQLLRQAGTTGFSVYPAEATEVPWDDLGREAALLGFAAAP